MLVMLPFRFVTGTDFVSSMGRPEQFPGLRQFKSPPTGCMKDKANHARQLTDTSSINMFLSDEAFKNIVLGNNYFRLTGLDDTYAAPPLCGYDVRQIVGSPTVYLRQNYHRLFYPRHFYPELFYPRAILPPDP